MSRCFNITCYDCWNRKSHSESAASAFARTICNDSPPVRVNEFSDDREPETKSSVRTSRGAFCLPESLEDMG